MIGSIFYDPTDAPYHPTSNELHTTARTQSTAQTEAARDKRSPGGNPKGVPRDSSTFLPETEAQMNYSCNGASDPRPCIVKQTWCGTVSSPLKRAAVLWTNLLSKSYLNLVPPDRTAERLPKSPKTLCLCRWRPQPLLSSEPPAQGQLWARVQPTPHVPALLQGG